MAINGRQRERTTNGCGERNNIESSPDSSQPPQKTGCHLTTATGVALALIGLGVAMVTGLIAYLTAPAKMFECQCVVPECPSVSPPPPATTFRVTMPTTTVPSVTTPPVTTTTTEVPVIDRHLRLPRSLLPLHYRLELEPQMYGEDPEKFFFRGSVDILVECLEATDNITLHVLRLSIDNTSINLLGTNGMTTPRIHGYQTSDVQQLMILNLDGHLKPGSRYHVIMDFVAPLRLGWRGLYLVEYKENNGTTYMAGTQFAHIYARTAFPCFDEPGLKATFALTIVRRNDYTALTNTALIRSEPRKDQMIADIFDTTPKMSTYNLALIVTKFPYREVMTSNKVQIRVWTRPELLWQTDYALRLSAHVLVFFEEFYRIRYPLPKLDMVALDGFLYGGMENWGLILYNENALLVEPGVTSAKAQERIASVISHEIAHQWFGNLITMKWWDDIWLNEGFANYYHNIGVNSFHPEWKMHQLTIINQLHDAFDHDNRKTSHPLKFSVDTTAKINDIYDRLPYVKGSSILRMFEHFLGEDVFDQGIQSYLKLNAYGSVTHSDFAEAMETARGGSRHGVPVRDILATWLFQMNYPVVTIKRSADHSITVSQKRFVLCEREDESETFSSRYGYKWDIPFTFTTSLVKHFNTTQVVLLWWDQEQAEISDRNLIPSWSYNNSSWVIGNVRQIGFYRVNYEMDNWVALIRQLKEDHAVFPVENRAQIINDAWNFVRSGLLDAHTALNASQYLEAEQSYIPWRAAAVEFEYVCHMLSKTALYGSFQAFMRSLVQRQYHRIDWEDKTDSHLDSLFQNLILTHACDYGVPECVTKAKRLYSAWMKEDTVNPVPVKFRDVVYCTAIAYGDQQEWDFAARMYRESNATAERDRIVSALGCTREPWMVIRYLSWSLKEEADLQLAMVASMAKRCSTRRTPLLWRFVQEHWEKLSSRTRYALYKTLFKTYFNTAFDIQHLERFIDDNLFSKKLKECVLTAQLNLDWMKNNYETIQAWFNDHGYGV